MDTVMRLDLHYESLDHGPTFYFDAGEEVAFYYEGQIGAKSIYLISRTKENKFNENKIVLQDSITKYWVSSFNVTQSGCYTLNFGSKGPLAYSAGVLNVMQSVTRLRTCVMSDQGKTFGRGGERYLTIKEVVEAKRKLLPVNVKKEITSGGVEYCEAELKLNPGQKVLINFDPKGETNRNNIAVYKRTPKEQTTILEEFQFGIEDFGFESINGGTYLIQFWGVGVFKRTDDLKIETVN